MPAKPLRIFHVITRLNVGGAALCNIQLTEQQRRLGHDAWLVYGSLESYEDDMLQYIPAEDRRFERVVIPEMTREIRPVKDFVAFVKLVRLFWRERPDIVHTHTSKAGLLGRAAAWVTGVPVIVHTFHGTVFQGYFGGLMNRTLLFIERALAKISHGLLADTRAVLEEAAGRGVGTRERMHVHQLGLDLREFETLGKHRGLLRRHLGLSPRTKIVGMVARLVPIKGVEYFIAAIPEVLKAHPDTHFVIFGDGYLRDELQRQIDGLGIGDKVTLAGFWSNVKHALPDFDILALSSLSEGGCLAVLEGMAAGLPVVSSAVGGIPDAIVHGENGMLFPPTDSVAMAKQLTELLANPEKAARLGENARRLIFERYSLEASAEACERLYERFIAESRLSPGRQSPALDRP